MPGSISYARFGTQSGGTYPLADTDMYIPKTTTNLEQAEKLVVDNVVHIDHDHATDIIRIELGNDTKVPIASTTPRTAPRRCSTSGRPALFTRLAASTRKCYTRSCLTARK